MVTPPGATSKEAAFCQDEEDDMMFDYGEIYEGATGLDFHWLMLGQYARAVLTFPLPALLTGMNDRTSCGPSWLSLLLFMVVTIMSPSNSMMHSS